MMMKVTSAALALVCASGCANTFDYDHAVVKVQPSMGGRLVTVRVEAAAYEAALAIAGPLADEHCGRFDERAARFPRRYQRFNERSGEHVVKYKCLFGRTDGP